MSSDLFVLVEVTEGSSDFKLSGVSDHLLGIMISNKRHECLSINWLGS